MLCKTCLAVLPGLVVRVDLAISSFTSSQNQGYSHHTSLLQLSISAQRGCSLCQFLYYFLTLSGYKESELSHKQGTWWFKRAGPRLLKYYFCSEHQSFDKLIAWSIDKDIRREEVTDISSTVSLAAEVLDGQRTITKPLKQDPAESSGQCRIWIQECIKSHDACKTRASSSFLPTRIVDVRPGAAEDQVRVIITKETQLSDGGQYLALSYCWGNNANPSSNMELTRIVSGPRTAHVLTSENMSSYKEAILTSSLPATIRDAFTIVRQLGMRYIWIDALCILQDKIEDWERESAQMGNIYANAYCTIAASSASHSDEGILHPRSLGRCFAASIGAFDTAKILQEITKRHSAQISQSATNSKPGGESLEFYVMNSDWDKPLWRNPLSSRGWALQEQHLSTRILYYTNEEVYWQCCSFSASEQLPVGLLPGLEMTKSYRIFDDFRGEESYAELVSSRWFHLVNDMTGRDFTEPLDLLPALSGIAGEIERLTGYKYFAGLWEKKIFMGLLWRGPVPGKRIDNYRAPSWSWASVEGRITFIDFYKGYDQTVYKPGYRSWPQWKPELLDIKVVPVGFDPRGRLSSGYLRLSCYLKTARYLPCGSVELRQYNRATLVNFETPRSAEHRQEVGKVWLDVRSEHGVRDDTVHIAILHYVTREEKKETILHHGIGLALRETDAADKTWRRVGLAYDISMYWFAQDCKEESIVIV